MRNLLLFIAVIPCLLCGIGIADAQTDTILRLELLPDATLFKGNLKLQKKVQQAVDTFWIDGQSITIVCEKSPDIIEKVVSTVRNSAVEHSVVERPAEEETVQQSVVQSTTKEKYDPDIDKFLNIEDESVFSDSKFKNLNKAQIHPRSYKYYCLIKDIFGFRKKLEEIRKLGFQEVDQAKKLVDEMLLLAYQINGVDYESERNMLTQKQKEYYNVLYFEFEKYWNYFYKE